MATCNVQSLLDEASCFACLSPGVLQVIELQLLCEILNQFQGGGGGGIGQEVFVGHYGAAPPVFVAPLNRGIAYDLDAPFPTFKWNPDTQAWE